jgi:hypothetical protein
VPVTLIKQGLSGAIPHCTALVEATEGVMHEFERQSALQVHRTAPLVPVDCWKQVAWFPPQLILPSTELDCGRQSTAVIVKEVTTNKKVKARGIVILSSHLQN